MRRRLRKLAAAGQTPARSASPVSARLTRSVTGAKTPAQLTRATACAGYKEARSARGLESQTDSIGHSARAAEAAAAAAPRRGAAATTSKKAAQPVAFVDDEASERRGRTHCGRGTYTYERDSVLVRRLPFDEEAPAEVASLASPDEDARQQRWWHVRLILRVQPGVTAGNVQCELRVASSADALADALADLNVGATPLADDACRGSTSAAPDATASEAGHSLRARLARLGLRPLTPQATALSYLGWYPPLLALMKSRGMHTISCAAVRAFLLAAEGGKLAADLVAAHGASSFAELQIDHIIPRKWGGVDHPYNYFVLRASLNASFGSDGAQPRKTCIVLTGMQAPRACSY